MSEPTVWAKAKAEIERRGWWQGDYNPPDPENFDDCPVCILGALSAVLFGTPHPTLNDKRTYEWRHVRVALAGHIGVAPYESRIGCGWNDADERTVEDVYRVLDELDAAERQAVSP